MKKIVRLTEDDLTRIVKRVILEQTAQTKPNPPRNRPTQPSSQPMNLVGKKIMIYVDKDSKKPYSNAEFTIKSVNKEPGSYITIKLDDDYEIHWSCKNSDRFILIYKFLKNEKIVYNKPLLAQLKKDYCMVGSGGLIIPKVDFGDNPSDTDVKIA